jgi:hypothetical protein
VFRKPVLRIDHAISVLVSDSVVNWNVYSDKNGNAVIGSNEHLEAKIFMLQEKNH